MNDTALYITHTWPVGQSTFDPERIPGCGSGRKDRIKMRGKEKGFIPLSRPVCQQMVSEIRLGNGPGFEPQALQFFGQDAAAFIDSFFAESPAVDIDKVLSSDSILSCCPWRRSIRSFIASPLKPDTPPLREY